MIVRVVSAAVVLLVLVALGSPAAPASAATLHDHDFDGDGSPDVVATHQNGRLYLFPSDGNGAWRRTPIKLGQGWRHLDEVHLAGDWNGDGDVDVVARHVPTGELLLYPGDGRGGLQPTRRIGSGWNAFSEIAFPGDWSGDGEEDAVAVRRSDGTLWLYPGDGGGGWLSPQRAGSGWQTRDLVTAVGDWDGDGHPDLVARAPSNDTLWLYRGDGRGGFLDSRVIGTEWDGVTALVGPGDWDGDGRNDVLARDRQGRLVLYRGDGHGGFAGRPQTVGSGWQDLRLNEPTRTPERVIRYSAAGLGPAPAEVEAFARFADWTLNDVRGWSLGYDIRYDRVRSGGELTLHLATSDELAGIGAGCAEAGSCRVGDRIYIGAQGWSRPPLTYADRGIEDYRHFVVNHEVGSWLGLPDSDCPGLRKQAPVMLQQSVALGLCDPNPWPLPEETEAAQDLALY